jgi:hypothetical protein
MVSESKSEEERNELEEEGKNKYIYIYSAKYTYKDTINILKSSIQILFDGRAHWLVQFRGVNTNYRLSCPLWDRQMASFCSAALTRAYYYTSRCMCRIQAMNAKQVKCCPTCSNTPQQLQLFQMDHSQVHMTLTTQYIRTFNFGIPLIPAH